jgi:hypothetical protein
MLMHEISFIYALTRLHVPPIGEVPPVQNLSGIYQEHYRYTNILCRNNTYSYGLLYSCGIIIQTYIIRLAMISADVLG